jgi:hypothetical protein
MGTRVRQRLGEGRHRADAGSGAGGAKYSSNWGRREALGGRV